MMRVDHLIGYRVWDFCHFHRSQQVVQGMMRLFTRLLVCSAELTYASSRLLPIFSHSNRSIAHASVVLKELLATFQSCHHV